MRSLAFVLCVLSLFAGCGVNEETLNKTLDTKLKVYNNAFARDFAPVVEKKVKSAVGAAVGPAVESAMKDFETKAKDAVGAAVGPAVNAAVVGMEDRFKLYVKDDGKLTRDDLNNVGSNLLRKQGEILDRLTGYDSQLAAIQASLNALPQNPVAPLADAPSTGGSATSGSVGQSGPGDLDVSTSVNGVKIIYKGSGSLAEFERILKEQQEKSERQSHESFLRGLIKNGDKKTDQNSRADDVDARKTDLERDLPEKLSDIESEMKKHGEGIVGINARMDVFHKRIEELAALRAAKVEYRPPVGKLPGPVLQCGPWNVCPSPSRRVIHAWCG